MGVATIQQKFIYKNKQEPDLVHELWFDNLGSIYTHSENTFGLYLCQALF